MSTVSLNEFLDAYVESLEQGSAALFAGAGLSQASGFVNWKELLRGIADDLGLDIDRESDLVALAQYDVNKRGGQKGRLNQLLIEEFTRDAQLSPNHRLIAKLPLRTVWTTNYDSLIEQAFREANKRVDLKISKENLAVTLPRRDVVIYKMHGDVSQPHEAVLIKEDYETYEEKRKLFSTMLQGDLISKTFLFLGFSFTDPNIDYILSRIRGLLGENQRQHYCIMKWPTKPTGGGEELAKYEYERKKLEFRIGDLNRYSIQVVMIEEYDQIPEILKELNRRSHLKDIFVSGSAHDYQPLGRDRIEKLSRAIGREIISRGYNLISGFGLGIGGAVIVGAMERLYDLEREGRSTRARTWLRPFPQHAPANMTKQEFNTAFRRDMISVAGFSIFLCGNRFDAASNGVKTSPGVLEEFKISTEVGGYPIPLGASGHAAALIWQEVTGDSKRFYGDAQVTEELTVLNDLSKTDDEYIAAIFSMTRKISKARK